MGESAKSTAKFILEVVEIIVIAFLISWFLRTYVIDARVVPSGSMLPTIQLQDRVVVDKFFYKYFGNIERGDIIVFHPPQSAHSLEDFIKRVIGLSGDTIEIKNHVTYVNGQPLEEPYLWERPYEDFGPIVVPEDSLFVMGDNRNNSDDSRRWGFLPKENVAGWAFFRYWPLDRVGPLN